MPEVKTIPCLITIYCHLLDCIATIVVHKVQQIASVKKLVSFKIYTTCAKPLPSIVPMAIKILTWQGGKLSTS